MEISCQRGAGYTLVTPGAVETPEDADTLHAVLLESFAEADDAVVCDVTGAAGPPDACAALVDAVLAVAEQVRGWPSALLVAVGPGPAAAAGELPPPLAVVTRVADAVRVVAARPRVQATREVLQPLLQAPALARTLLRRTLATWGAGAFLDDAMLVVDELVANAVLHAGTEIEVWFVLGGGRLGVAVADRSPDRPSLVQPVVDAGENGRGLLLVDAVAGDWHVLPRRGGGKVVRAVLTAAPAGRDDAGAAVGSPAGLSRSAGPRGGRS